MAKLHGKHLIEMLVCGKTEFDFLQYILLNCKMFILQLLNFQEPLKNCQNLLLLICTAIMLLMCLVTDLNCYNNVVCLDDVGVDDSDQVDVPEADGVPVDTNHHGEDIATNKKKEKEKKQPTVSLRL